MARSRLWLSILAATLLTAVPAAAAPDPVLEWMKITNDTVIASGTTALFTGRPVALVAAAVFDAVNGIERRYQPIHVRANAPRHASERAAAVQAANAILVRLYPARAASLTASRDASITRIGSDPGAESAPSIQAGMVWGQAAADGIWDWRSTDGFNPNPAPPYLGVLGRPTAGVWRPTPKADGSAGNAAAGPQIATMVPWVMMRASQFRPSAPYASPVTGQIDLASAQYLADYQETKMMGAYAGPRTADQSELALFWNGNTPLFWIRIASQISAAQHLTLSQNAHLFALLNLTMGDAAIACWDAKYRFGLWRPISAVREGAIDRDPTWRPWLDFFPGGHAGPSGVPVRPFNRQRCGGVHPRIGIRGQHTLYDRFRLAAGNAIVLQLLRSARGNSRCAGLRRHSLEDRLPDRGRHRPGRGRVRFDAYDAPRRR